MATRTPNYTDTGTAIIALATLAVGSTLRGTLDLRTKDGAWFYCFFGRQGTTALTTGLQFLIRRMLNNGAIIHPVGPVYQGDITAAVRTTCAGSGNNAGVVSVAVASTTTFAVGDPIFIDDTGNVGIANSEWKRVSKVIDSTHLGIDSPTEFAHNSVNAHVSNHADVWGPYWVDGGCVVEVIADYGASTTGDTNAVRVLYGTRDSDSIA